MISDEDILAEFRAADALLEGHFILSSGLRSPRYLQCARVLMNGARAERLARALASKIPADLRERIEVVVSPAMGGVIIGHEMGRALGRPAMFVERPQGLFELRRGFRIEPRCRVLMVAKRSMRCARPAATSSPKPRWSTARAARPTLESPSSR